MLLQNGGRRVLLQTGGVGQEPCYRRRKQEKGGQGAKEKEKQQKEKEEAKKNGASDSHEEHHEAQCRTCSEAEMALEEKLLLQNGGRRVLLQNGVGQEPCCR